MYRIKLVSQPDLTYRLSYGWYSYAGNRKTIGWYLTNLDNNQIRPFYDIDVDDIFMWSCIDPHNTRYTPWNKESFKHMIEHIDFNKDRSCNP